MREVISLGDRWWMCSPRRTIWSKQRLKKSKIRLPLGISHKVCLEIPSAIGDIPEKTTRMAKMSQYQMQREVLRSMN
jgi:hypothetical protein